MASLAELLFGDNTSQAGLDMVTIMRNFKLYQFSKWSIALCCVGTILGALAFYYLTETYLGFWIEGGIAYGVAGILQMCGTPIRVQLSNGSSWRFTGCPYGAIMSFGCTGFEMVAVCVAFILFHPHPQNAVERKGIWVRKAKAILISSGIMQGVNFFRLIIEMSQVYYWGTYHMYVMIAEALITIPAILFVHRWMPELVVPHIFGQNLTELEVFQNLGINSIEQFAREDPIELANILGISPEKVSKWILAAKRSLESPYNPETSIDLIDISLWYSRVKLRSANYLKFIHMRDINHFFEVEQVTLTEISKKTSNREDGIPVPAGEVLDAMQESPTFL